MDTYTAWVVEQRPIYSRLPDCYKEDEENISDWLTQYWDKLLLDTKTTVDDLPRQLDPLTCDEEWLDYLSILCGWYGEYWDVRWPAESKRTLLANSFTLIWPNKGSFEVLSFVLFTLGIKHFIQIGQSFLVGISEVGDRIGSVAWDYDILLPSTYYRTDIEKLTNKINKLFGPCWCRSSVIFDDSKFKTYRLYALEDGTLLSPGIPRIFDFG
jgi:hypothetical protein